jgi:GNAT superfamily N-acetyltransferase
VRPVTEANVDDLIQLDVAAEQQGLVGSVAKSIAQASVRPAGTPLGIYDGDTPVGLLLLWDVRRDPDEPADQLYVWRIMVDANHQRKGYGAKAMHWVIDEARRLGMASVGLSHQDLPGHAGPFYEKIGFRYTGKVEHNERLMVLDLEAFRG